MEKEILARTATIVPLSASVDDLKLPGLKLFFGGYNVRPSLVASRKDHDDMLKFAALHGIKPRLEEFPMTEEGWTEALGKLESGAIRYRAVLCSE